MPFLFKLSKRVARLRSRVLLVAAAAVAGACAKEVASPAGEKTPVAIQISALDVKPGGSIAVVLRATQPLAAIQETVAFDPQRLHYERQGDGPDIVVVNDEAAAQGSLKVLATNPQGLASPGVTLVFTVTANGYTEGIGGTLELAVAPDDRLVWGTAPSAADRAAGTSPAGSYRFGDVNLDGLVNLFDVLVLVRASGGTPLTAQAFLLGNVRPVNGGATATGTPPCDPATTCRPGVTPADAQSPSGRIAATHAGAVASSVIGLSVPVVGELAPNGPVTPAAVASVTVSPATASIWVGQTDQLTATPKDSAGGTLTGRTVTWTSSNTSVATVSSSGLVTSGVPGTATITATSEGKAGSAVVTATSVPVASVAVSPGAASIRVGQTVQLAATPKDSSGSTLAGRTVTWASGDTTVARVSPSGLVTGVAPGTASIIATSEGKSGTAAITMTTVPVASVAVSPATAGLQVGQTVQLTAAPKDSAGIALTGRAVTWTSSNSAMATVSSSGLVKGVAPGTATITATSEGKAGSAAVTVTLVPVASVVVSPAAATVAVGQTVQLTATPQDSAGGTLTGRTVTWTSSNTSVATVSSSGLV